MLQNSGPVGIWLWPIVALGQTLIALVIAQFAARIPLSGSSYQWASRLANPKIGWLFGWLSFCYLAIGVVTVDNAMASTALMPLFGMQPDENTARVITLVVLVIQAVLVVHSTRLVGLITSGAVGLELVIVVVLTVALFIAVAITGRGLGQQPHLARCCGRRPQLFRHRRRVDGCDDHGPRHARRLRLRGEHG